MNDNPIRKTIPALACALLLAAWCGPARAQGKAKDLARDTGRSGPAATGKSP